MGLAEATVGTLRVEVAFSPAPRQVQLVTVNLPQGATVQQALEASAWLGCVEGLSLDAIRSGDLGLGVWGRRSTLDQNLREGDRVEVYRSLEVDPKEARRARFRAHGDKVPRGTGRNKARQAG